MKEKPKKTKKNMVISQKEHDEWHSKHGEYDGKMDKEHQQCHKKVGITVVKG